MALNRRYMHNERDFLQQSFTDIQKYHLECPIPMTQSGVQPIGADNSFEYAGYM